MISRFKHPAGLAVIALLLFATTLLALFIQSREVLAKVAGAAPAHNPQAESDYVYWGFRTNEIKKLIDELWEQRESLDAREKQIALEEARMMDERQELERMREEIRGYRAKFSKQLVEVQKAEIEHLRNEVAIYANMTPEHIVMILREKDDREVVKLLSLMKADTIARIMEQMIKDGGTSKDSAGRPARLLEQLQRLQRAQK